MGKLSAALGAALLLTLLLSTPVGATTVPEYAKTKLDSHFSSLNALQSLVDLFMGRDTTYGTANASTTRWTYFLGNAQSLAGILVNNTIGGAGGADAYAVLFDSATDTTLCSKCARNFSRALSTLANNSTSIFGDSAGTTGRASVWREYRNYLESTTADNASRNVSRLVQLQSSLIRDALTLYTENLKASYSILGI